MRILLIVPNYSRVILDTTSIPLGLASIATCLRDDGHDINCIDCSVTDIDSVKPDYKRYDFIGIQLHSVESLNEGIRFIKQIRALTDSRIVVGGIVATLYYRLIIQYREIDYIILNEGEYTFIELVRAIQEGKDVRDVAGLIINCETPITTAPRGMISNLDDLPIVDRSLFEWEKYKQWSIITSRGCPFKCKFCTVPAFWNNTYRQRSPEHVFEEIRQLVEKYDIHKFFMLDDSFTVNKQNAMALLSMMKGYLREFEWACLTRADLLDEDLVKALAETHCSTVSIGVESANQDTLDSLNKNLDLRSIENAISLLKKYKIRVRCSYIFGFPNETEAHLQNNISFILKTLPEEVQIYPLFPYFGTELNRENELDIQQFVNGKDALNPIIGTNTLSKEDIARYVKKCVEALQSYGYIWLSSCSTPPHKGKYGRVVMTEFAPIQALE